MGFPEQSNRLDESPASLQDTLISFVVAALMQQIKLVCLLRSSIDLIMVVVSDPMREKTAILLFFRNRTVNTGQEQIDKDDIVGVFPNKIDTFL